MFFFFRARRGQMVTPPNTVCHLAQRLVLESLLSVKRPVTKGGQTPVQMNGGSTFHHGRWMLQIMTSFLNKWVMAL